MISYPRVLGFLFVTNLFVILLLTVLNIFVMTENFSSVETILSFGVAFIPSFLLSARLLLWKKHDIKIVIKKFIVIVIVIYLSVYFSSFLIDGPTPGYGIKDIMWTVSALLTYIGALYIWNEKITTKYCKN